MLAKKYLLALLIFSFILGGAYLFAADITGSAVGEKVGIAAAPPTLVIDSGDCGTNISACNAVWVDNTIYCLDSDVALGAAGTCINFSADWHNITFSCQDYTIDGPAKAVGSYGVGITNASVECDNITIADCVITDFEKGIFIGDVTDAINITQNNITANTYGIESNTSQVGIINNTFQENTIYDINLSRSTSSVVDYNTFSHTMTGTGAQAYLFYHNNASITNNIFNSNLDAKGLYIYASQSNAFTNNTVSASHKYSFYSEDFPAVTPSTANTITDFITSVGGNTTNTTFTYSGTIITVNASGAPDIPTGNVTLNYLAVNVSAPSDIGDEYIYLNFSYTTSDLNTTGANESTLELWAYNESTGLWSVVTGSAVDTTNKRVHGNITNPDTTGMIVAPLGATCTNSDGDSYDICNESDIEDSDGYAYDCNDSAALIYPDAQELCDGIDNDCDGTADEDDVCASSGGSTGASFLNCAKQGGVCCALCDETNKYSERKTSCNRDGQVCCKTCKRLYTCTTAGYTCCEEVKDVTEASSSYDDTCGGDYVCGVSCEVDAPPANLSAPDKSSTLITGKTTLGGIPTTYFILAQILLGLLAGFCFLIYKLAAK